LRLLGLDERGAAIEINMQIVIMARQHKIDGMRIIRAVPVILSACTIAITRSAPAARALLALARTTGIVGAKARSPDARRSPLLHRRANGKRAWLTRLK